MSEELIQIIRNYPLPKLDGFYSVPSAKSYEELRSKFFKLVSSLEPGITEIIFHPSVETEGLRRITGSWRKRVRIIMWPIWSLLKPKSSDCRFQTRSGSTT